MRLVQQGTGCGPDAVEQRGHKRPHLHGFLTGVGLRADRMAFMNLEPQRIRVPATGGVELSAIPRLDGDRVPVLLVHGLASNARLWDGVGEELSARGYPSVAIDLRGHGRS